jgi:hypothetical protein
MKVGGREVGAAQICHLFSLGAHHQKTARSPVPSICACLDTVMAPNKILYCSNMPAATTKEMLEALFGEFEGLQEVRGILLQDPFLVCIHAIFHA